MTCRKFRKYLLPWLDGELKPEQATEMKVWFDSCEEVRHCSVCRKLTEEYRSFHRAFQSIPQTEFPAFLHHKILSEIQSREKIYTRKAVRIRWQAIPATIAVILSLYVGSLIGIRTFNTQTETQELYSFGENGMVSTLYNSGGLE